MNQTKTCKCCNKEFELEHFNYQCRKTNRLRAYCKYCDRARAKKDYRDNREHKIEVMRAWKERNNYKAPGGYKTNPIPGVYMMVNVETGERYIGSSSNVYRRRSAWVVQNSHLKLDMDKFIWGVMYEGDDYEQVEKQLVRKYQPELNTWKYKTGTK